MTVRSDIEIAQQAQLTPITEVAAKVGLTADDLELYGKYKAKISFSAIRRLQKKADGKLVLVTAITPTPAGEGKTLTSIGLAQAMNKLGTSAVVALREPSMGPVFGMKGGAAGGGYAQVLPMEDINLHFTGDMHAITVAHNLLAAALDNHVHQGNALRIDVRRILWKRVVDMNDRALRNIVVAMGGKVCGFPREDHFMITVASEIMAILCLATDLMDLKKRMAAISVAYDLDGKLVTAGQLGVAGAMAILLKDAVKPNLVQTSEHTPALIHGGPFANIAHGCNSIIATKLALKMGDVAITEAGFGADLGAEKFMDIVCPYGNLQPHAAVLVATVRALKLHGHADPHDLASENTEALQAGLDNLAKHLDNLQQFGVPAVVGINRFTSDTEREIQLLRTWCAERDIPVAINTCWRDGGDGGQELAQAVLQVLKQETRPVHPLYEAQTGIAEKVKTVVQRIYGGEDVVFTNKAKKQLQEIEDFGWGHLPICMAKTQYSLSDDPQRLGAPTGFTVTIDDVSLCTGAGFIVCRTGNVMVMPGLPKVPAATRMDIDETGKITGLF